MSNDAAASPQISPPSRPLRVAVIEDHHEFREYLAALISGTDGFTCLGSFRSVEEAWPKLKAQVPDVMLIDIGLPGMNGIDGIRFFKEKYPEILFLTLTIHDDDERIFDALCAGASGYLLKKTQPSRLVESVKEAAHGGAPMSPEIARRVINLFRQIRPPERADYDLTPHEIRILKLLVEGHNYKTAATRLGVAPTTINFHLQNIYQKLQVHSKTEAVAKALRNRLI
ncbi:MAG TPA: response regulator transcription factor [Pyrinomonadaceae bacterium]|nr:response regulator transcription factor [Pyrinomonadaceae bacterium]